MASFTMICWLLALFLMPCVALTNHSSCVISSDQQLYQFEMMGGLVEVSIFENLSISSKHRLSTTGERQQGVSSLLSCTTVGSHGFVLLSTSIQNYQLVSFHLQRHEWSHVWLPRSIDPSDYMATAWHSKYLVYSDRTVHVFDLMEGSWDVHELQDIPSDVQWAAATSAVVRDVLYFFFFSASSSLVQMYGWDLKERQWLGQLGVFASATPFAVVGEQTHADPWFYLVSALSPEFGLRLELAMSMGHSASVQIQQEPVQLKEIPRQGLWTTMDNGTFLFYNDTLLVQYQPWTKACRCNDNPSICQAMGNGTDPPPVPPSTSLTHTQVLKIALGTSIGAVAFVVVVVAAVVLIKRKKQLEAADAATQASPTMATLSNLQRDNALTWSRNVHRSLAMVSFEYQQEQPQQDRPCQLAATSSSYPSMIISGSSVLSSSTSSSLSSYLEEAWEPPPPPPSNLALPLPSRRQ
ncbi:hypothetical protein DM01DRAFT_337259 [Hesseltinella vesiculosa]|uniref:Uncharacterized protein n=1 Tax=Hesseltinella vesiculosa TaxID=101127 RepID=A0A1X2GG46_9FUNG|nr:hypothetical protein DM01DRAFT_337259 [Hesseltinella vesiculosa]